MKARWNKGKKWYELFYAGQWLRIVRVNSVYRKRGSELLGWGAPHRGDLITRNICKDITLLNVALVSTPDKATSTKPIWMEEQVFSNEPDIGSREIPERVLRWALKISVTKGEWAYAGQKIDIDRNQGIRKGVVESVNRSNMVVRYQLPNAGWVRTKVSCAVCGELTHFLYNDFTLIEGKEEVAS